MSKEKTLMIMNVYDTIENGRSRYTIQTLASLEKTVDFRDNELYIVNQNSHEDSGIFIKAFKGFIAKDQGIEASDNIKVITLDENIGTARGMNLAIRDRGTRHVLKFDNDVVWHTKNWVEKLELAQEKLIVYKKNEKGELVLDTDKKPIILSQYGILGCKRKDCAQSPYDTSGWFKSEVSMIPHEAGEEWLFIEQCADIMGTCVLYTGALLDKVGYAKQYGVYGWEDCLLSHRSTAAGFKNGFVHPIHIDHIDVGDNPYIKTKQQQAGEVGELFQAEANAILQKKQSYYFDFY